MKNVILSCNLEAMCIYGQNTGALLWLRAKKKMKIQSVFGNTRHSIVDTFIGGFGLSLDLLTRQMHNIQRRILRREDTVHLKINVKGCSPLLQTHTGPIWHGFVPPGPFTEHEGVNLMCHFYSMTKTMVLLLSCNL